MSFNYNNLDPQFHELKNVIDAKLNIFFYFQPPWRIEID